MPNVPDVPLDGLYGDLILEHFRGPRNRAVLPDADLEAEEFNPFCGDRIILQLKLDDTGRVVQVGVQSEGCSIIQATASLMSEAMRGKKLEELEDLAGLFRETMRGNTEDENPSADLGPLQSLTVVRRFPVRIKCALLPWVALEEGIKNYRSSQTRDQ
ncbi:MAG: SUF system NifU family Fe-S cluster assembly protein [SAR202 cluster bacterium Io17-Chloro-G4]|nr:MAG: SUF system NifU family Fe-S cluster assembly protein [SAR202 cluster bacterium Io17-Chloro-G4]